MALAVSTPPTASEQIDLAFDRLRHTNVADSKSLATAMAEVEEIKRKALALSIDLMITSESAGLHYQDGHTSAQVMARHINKLSGADALGRDRCRRMFADLLVLAAAARDGSLGTDQLMLLARVWSNPRVRKQMSKRQQRFLKDARRLSFPRFRDRLLEWERITDEDGAEPERDRTFESRNAQLIQNHFDQSWDLHGIFTAGDGAAMREVLDAYAQVLFDADWAEARGRLGGAACTADLSRTDSQRRSDAVRQIFADAVANKAGMAPNKVVHGIIWSQQTFEEMARRFAGGDTRPFDPETYRCETTDGQSLDPTEAFASAVVNKIRRVVVDAKGVVIDMGSARSFTGLARDAVRTTGRECLWPGCWVPATRCETDHLDDYAKGGRTNSGNGAPCCGRHNRWKQKGYRVWRDEIGQIRTYRPDGSEIS